MDASRRHNIKEVITYDLARIYTYLAGKAYSAVLCGLPIDSMGKNFFFIGTSHKI